MTDSWGDPRLARLQQQLVDKRARQISKSDMPKLSYGTVVSVDSTARICTVRFSRPTGADDVPGVGMAWFTPTVGQRVRVIYWPATGDRYIDDSTDEVDAGTGSPTFTNPMTAIGDLIVGTTGGSPSALPSENDGDVLTVQADGTLAWEAPAAGASFATPAIVLGSAAGAGAASTVIRSDSTIAAFDATDPSTQAFGDAAAVGAAAFAARRDHKHAMMADPVTAHEAAGDPHTGYRLESADHTHASSGAQAGTVDHGVLTGLADDDHPQYGPAWDGQLVKGSDESVASSAAVQNDDDFFFSTVDNALYEIEAVIGYINSGGSGPDLKMDFGEDGNTRGSVTATGVSAADAASTQSALTNQSDTVVFGTATGMRGIFIKGAFRGAGGTWRIRWAQNSSNASATTLQAGSVLRYRRIY